MRVKNSITRLDESHWTGLNFPMGLKFHYWTRLSFLSLMPLQWVEMGPRVIRRNKTIQFAPHWAETPLSNQLHIKSQTLSWLESRAQRCFSFPVPSHGSCPTASTYWSWWKLRTGRFPNFISAFKLNTLIFHTFLFSTFSFKRTLSFWEKFLRIKQLTVGNILCSEADTLLT